MKLKLHLVGLMMGFGILTMISQETKAQDLGKYEALYIYNFTKYIQWPDIDGALTIGTFGEGSINTELDKMVKMKGAGNLIYKKLSATSDVSSCQIVFLTKSEDRKLDEILAATNGKSILVISENEDSAKKGAAISFYMDGDKLKFIINKGVIDSKKMKVSSSLMTLAKVI